MDIVLVTGSAGLIGAETARFFSGEGFKVVGIDNDMRRQFFGDEASTAWSRRELESSLADYVHHAIDIRDRQAVEALFAEYGSDLKAVIHTAAQPSHDWAAKDPHTDFTVNANGTLDTTFGTGGKATVDLSQGGVYDYAESVAIQPLAGGSFRIVTTGYAEVLDPSSPYGRWPMMTVAGFTPSGALDPTFADGGIAKTGVQALDSGTSQVRYWWGTSLALQRDGKIVVNGAGATTNDSFGIGLTRYTADGLLDTTFANYGSTLIEHMNGLPIGSRGWNSIAVDPLGRAVVAGEVNTNPASSTGLDFLVARFSGDQSSAMVSDDATDVALMLLLSDMPTTTTKRK